MFQTYIAFSETNIFLTVSWILVPEILKYLIFGWYFHYQPKYIQFEINYIFFQEAE